MSNGLNISIDRIRDVDYDLITGSGNGVKVAYVYKYHASNIMQLKQLSTIQAGTRQGIGFKIVKSIVDSAAVIGQTLIISSGHGAKEFYDKTLDKLGVTYTTREMPSLFDLGEMTTEYNIKKGGE